MWHLDRISKRCFFYWGKSRLSYLRYLTIATFSHYNPTWEIIIYTPLITQTGISWTTAEQKYGDNYIDCFDRIREHNVIIKEMDFRGINFYNEASDVHKSDFLRWWLLHEYGGLWVDMDILFIKPMDDLIFNTPNNSNVNAVFCINNAGSAKGYIHSIGFLMGGKNNDYFKTIHNKAESQYAQESY